MVDIPGPKIRAGSFGTTPVALADRRRRSNSSRASARRRRVERIVVEREGVLAHFKPATTSTSATAACRSIVTKSGERRSRGRHLGRRGHRQARAVAAVVDPQRPPAHRRRPRAPRGAAHEDFEILAVSFVRSAFDMVSVRTVLGRDDVMIMAKIETGEGVENLDEIIAVSDAIMVARGDLGVRMPIEEVPAPAEGDRAPRHPLRAPGRRRDPDARVDDPRPGAHARRGDRRRQRGPRRRERGHAQRARPRSATTRSAPSSRWTGSCAAPRRPSTTRSGARSLGAAVTASAHAQPLDAHHRGRSPAPRGARRWRRTRWRSSRAPARA